ncbi:MAG: hypothetical protein ACTSUR_00730, partial [Candidatus Heimdallarchaeaceae archaeon]
FISTYFSAVTQGIGSSEMKVVNKGLPPFSCHIANILVDNSCNYGGFVRKKNKDTFNFCSIFSEKHFQ